MAVPQTDILPSASPSAQTFPAGLYVHIPFCTSFCSYCDFASEIHKPAAVARYLKALEKELCTRVAELAAVAPFAPRTVYIGGGTPSALQVAELAGLFDLLARNLNLDSVEEFTIEANPGSVDAAKLELFRRRGVNRISFGVQSFQPRLLKLLGRIHGPEDSRQVVRLARAAGFGNVSIDLMHGLPTQSRDELRRDVDEAASLGTEHVSAYGLSYEEDTPLYRAVERGELAPLPAEEEARQYLAVIELLEEAGLRQYEISNYARPGLESRHNLIYWRNQAYLGVGASAASFLAWQRSNNHSEVAAYLEAVEATGLATETAEVLDASARAREALVLELRLRRGVSPEEFRACWGVDCLKSSPLLQGFLQEGLMEMTVDGRYRISKQGLPVADSLLAEFV
ncbi:MAG: radical SAM family heme chaperone HemW [Planctomycetota bacterium]